MALLFIAFYFFLEIVPLVYRKEGGNHKDTSSLKKKKRKTANANV